MLSKSDIRVIKLTRNKELFLDYPKLFYFTKTSKDVRVHKAPTKIYQKDWSRKQIFIYYKLCSGMTNFKKIFYTGWKSARNHGILPELRKLKPYGKEKYTKHSLTSVLNTCRIHEISSINSFRKKFPSEYQQAYQQEWMPEIKKYFKKRLMMKYKKIDILVKKFKKTYPYFYSIAKDPELHEFFFYFPLKKEQIKKKCERELIMEVPPLTKIYEEINSSSIKKIRKKYKGIRLKSKTFQKKIFLRRQRVLLKQGSSRQENIFYSNKMIHEVSKKYKYRHQFCIMDTKAYSVAIRRKILDKVCSHMIKKKDSIGEQLTRKVFEKHFKSKFNKIKPEWLVNPKTKRLLELDGLNERLKIAFEVNGVHHHSPIFTKKTGVKFKDNIKNKICKEKGIKLYSIHYSNIKQLVRDLSDLFKINPDILYQEFRTLS